MPKRSTVAPRLRHTRCTSAIAAQVRSTRRKPIWACCMTCPAATLRRLYSASLATPASRRKRFDPSRCSRASARPFARRSAAGLSVGGTRSARVSASDISAASGELEAVGERIALVHNDGVVADDPSPSGDARPDGVAVANSRLLLDTATEERADNALVHE